MSKILVLYVFHDYNIRVHNFINNCIFEDEYIDFLLISNSHNPINIPNITNLEIMYRENIGYDFGGWSDGLLTNNLYQNYDNFIFVNSSVIGPFLPSCYKGKWTDIYINGLQNNIKLFGSIINTIDDPLNFSHVQSYIFSMDKNTLQYLIDCDIFSNTNIASDFSQAIWDKEVRMSKKIIENKWNIGCLFKLYNGVDFTFQHKKPEDYNITFLNDIMAPKYRNILWHDDEVVFIKGNRDYCI